MLKLTVYCDFCNQPMPEDEKDVIKGFKTKELDTKELFPHLCENCATKLDKVALLCRKNMLNEGNLVADMAKRNAERRELLGTRG